MPRVIFPDNALAPPASSTGPRPDLDGFAEAQGRLRQMIGVDAVFLVDGEPIWPAGTPIDPETGKPYDPFLEPETPLVTRFGKNGS